MSCIYSRAQKLCGLMDAPTGRNHPNCRRTFARSYNSVLFRSKTFETAIIRIYGHVIYHNFVVLLQCGTVVLWY